MIKVIITKDETEYRGHTPLTTGMTGHITKETIAETKRYGDGKITRVRFAAKPLGYEGREPVFIWVDNDSFKEVK